MDRIAIDTGNQSEHGAAPAWPEEIYRILKAQDVQHMSYVPDAGHTRLIELFRSDQDNRTNVLTTEEEGIGIAAGAWLGEFASIFAATRCRACEEPPTRSSRACDDLMDERAVVIIGGAIIGSMTAYFLRAEGYRRAGARPDLPVVVGRHAVLSCAPLTGAGNPAKGRRWQPSCPATTPPTLPARPAILTVNG